MTASTFTASAKQWHTIVDSPRPLRKRELRACCATELQTTFCLLVRLRNAVMSESLALP